MKRYYEILGLCPGATLDEVRQAYRDLVRVWHPDRFTGDYRLARISEEKLKSINEAYREVRAHIESHASAVDAEEGRRPLSPSDAGYLYEFYDYEYSPWIWTYKRIADAEEDARRRRARFRWTVGAGALVAGVAVGAAVLLLDLSALRGGMAGLWPIRAAAPSTLRPLPVEEAPPLPAADNAPPGASAGGDPAMPRSAGVPSDGEETSSGPDSSAAPAAGPVPAPAPPTEGKELPLGGAPFGRGIRGGNSRIGVENGTGSGAVVVLLRREGGGLRMVRNFFLPPGKAYAATEVPPGTYILQAALGASWDAEANRFRRPLRFGASGEIEVREEETAAIGAGGIVSRRRISSDLRLALERVLIMDIPERAFHGR